MCLNWLSCGRNRRPRPQDLIHGLIMCVLHGVMVHLVEVYGVVMVVMEVVVHKKASLN